MRTIGKWALWVVLLVIVVQVGYAINVSGWVSFPVCFILGVLVSNERRRWIRDSD